jgi:ABC-type dipeptide/oligopeptide/nickel transport system permease component
MRMAFPSTMAQRAAAPNMEYVLKRLASSILVVFGAITLVFLILDWLPGDPAMLLAGDGANNATIANIQAQLGTNRPLWVQYGSYLWQLAHLNLGTSFVTNEPVINRIWQQFPQTVELGACSCLVAVLFGVTLGIASAVYEGRWFDRAVQIVLLFLTSMPSFWIGILLILVFAVSFHWLPAMGSGSFRQLILPTACLGLGRIGHLERLVRSGVIDVLHEPFVTTLRGKGLKEIPILYRHVLRNALIPVITQFSMVIGEILSGVVVIETLFARQGLGRLIVDALSDRDIPVLQGVVLFVSIFYVSLNFFIDLSYVWIDRRTRI